MHANFGHKYTYPRKDYGQNIRVSLTQPSTTLSSTNMNIEKWRTFVSISQFFYLSVSVIVVSIPDFELYKSRIIFGIQSHNFCFHLPIAGLFGTFWNEV